MNFQIIKSTGLLLTVLGMAGCNQAVLPDFSTTGSVFGAAQLSAFKHTLTEKRPVQEAFVVLPNTAGSVFDVTQSRHGNGVEQLIVYQGDELTSGENVAKVQMVTADKVFGKRSENLKVASTSARQIRSEMRRALPGVSMQISNRLHTNAYGPFGYALGKASGNIRCIYGWQNMKGQSSDRWAILQGASAKPTLTMRVRVCRANTPQERLVDIMRHLRVEADPAQVLKPRAVSWNSGSGEDLSTALPQYEPGGYVSDPVDATPIQPEPTFSEPKPRVKKAKRVLRRKSKVVAKAPAAISKPVVSSKVYSPPLPNQVQAPKSAPIVKPVETIAQSIVPSPTGVVTATPARTVAYTSPLAPKPVAVREVKPVATPLNAVPLPNQ